MKYYYIVLPILIFCVFTTPHLNQGDYRRDTVRYAAIGHYMWSGGEMLTPKIHPQKNYYNKPPLALWIHGFFLKTFGISLVSSRVPSIIAGALTILISVLIIRGFFGEFCAFLSGFILACTYEYFRRVREISLDHWQLLFIMLAVFFGLKLFHKHKIKDTCIYSSLSGLFIGLALMCKPLVALIIILIFAITFVFAKRLKSMFFFVPISFFVAILISSPWHIFMIQKYGSNFSDTYLGSQVLDRATGTADFVQKKSYFYYVWQILGSYHPWLLVILLALSFKYKELISKASKGKIEFFSRESKDVFMFASVYIFVIMIALSYFPDKKVNYLLPIYPMLSWIVAFFCLFLLTKFNFKKTICSYIKNNYSKISAILFISTIIINFLPIKVQKPPDKNFSELISFLQKNEITNKNAISYNLSDNNLCYLYLKTGSWFKKIKSKDLPVITSKNNTGNGRKIKTQQSKFFITRTKNNKLANQENLSLTYENKIFRVYVKVGKLR